MNLADCLKKAGSKFTKQERSELANLVRALGIKSATGQAAEVSAVEAKVSELNTQRQAVVDVIKKHYSDIGPVEAPTPKEPERKQGEYNIGTAENIDPVALSDLFLGFVRSGDKLNKVGLQKIVAEELGITRSELVKNIKYTHKPVEEAFEYAIVKRAREIIAEGGTIDETYNQLKTLYNNQPLLATRTSTSIKNQAYSTPVHLAYLMQEFSGVTDKDLVYEPTAGTGMLLTKASATDKTWANEIGDSRAKVLKDQGYHVTKLDGNETIKNFEESTGENVEYDAVLANPPFGSIDKKKINDYTISKLEHAIVMDAFKALKDNGKAAFIIGGENFKKGNMADNQRVFLNWLYHNYNVVANIDIPDAEYTRQGAKFPVRLIVAHGRKSKPEGYAPREESAYQRVESIDDILPILKEVQSASLATKTPDVLGLPEEGVRPPGSKEGEGDSGQLPGLPRPEDAETPAGGTRPADVAGEPSSEGVGATTGEEQPGVAGTPEGGGRPGVAGGENISTAIPGEEDGPPGTKTEPTSRPERERTPADSETVSTGAKSPDATGISGTDSIINDLLNLSAQEAEKSGVKSKIEEGAAEVASAVKQFNSLLGEKGELGGDFDAKRWPQLHDILDQMWSGVKKMVKGIEAAAKSFIKEAYSKLSAKGKVYIDRFIQEDIRAELMIEKEGLTKVTVKKYYPEQKQYELEGSKYRVYHENLVKGSLYEGLNKVTGELVSVDEIIEGSVLYFKEPQYKEVKNLPKKKPTEKPEGTEFQVVYPPKSKGPIIDETLMPRKMHESVSEALDTLESEVGNIDDFVTDKLAYKNRKELYNHLAADQIDAAALAIWNMDKGLGMVVGDQTGVGKGRVAAAVYKYARLAGAKPVFFTEKPNLFTDFYRDIVDIGYDFNPFIMASNAKLGRILDQDENVVYTIPTPQERRTGLEQMMQRGVAGLDEKDGIVTTYSQVNQVNDQQRAIARVAPENFVIMDESHNASGQSNTGLFLRNLLRDVRGVTYLSATFAKRPDTMPIYYKTSMSQANLSMEGLISSIERGGTALQEIVSNNLARLGQYVRREKSFKGIEVKSYVDTKNKKKHEVVSDQMTEILRDIVEFDGMVSGFLGEVQTEIDAGESEVLGGIQVPGGTVDANNRPVTASVQSANFASVVHNAVRQLLLSIKADLAVEHAITELKAGRKPVIALSNTMGSFLEHQVSNGLINVGEPFALTSADVMERHLKRTLQFTIKGPTGDNVRGEIPVESLPDSAREVYDRIVDKISVATKDLPGSPIDYIKQKILQAGFSIEEITGRSHISDLSDPNIPILMKRSGSEKAKRKEIINGFNNGEFDALIVNAAGATGLSLHSSPKFKDQRPRTYLGIQAELNIDTEVQKMGRINRKGQVNLPKFLSLYIDTPSEIRPAAVLMGKMKSLSANTSANSDSPLSQETHQDMMNKYGNRVNADWLRANSQIMQTLRIDDPASTNIKQTTGRLAIQPVATQKEYYEAVEDEYTSLLEDEKQAGTYDLEVQDIDFKAELTSREKMTSGSNESNPFGESTWREELSVLNLKKPYKLEKIESLISEKLEPFQGWKDRFADNYVRNITEQAEKHVLSKKETASEEAYDRLVSQTETSINNIRSILGQHELGDLYNLRGIPGIDNMQGILIEIKHATGSGNPAAASRTKLIFAVNNALQKYTIPLSKLTGVRGVNLHQRDELYKSYWDDDLPSDVRSRRYMITGNLLQGYADASSGSRIVRFTMKDGTMREGILLPMNYRASAENTTVRVTGHEAVTLARNGVPLKGDLVEVMASPGEVYPVRVPSPRRTGGVYYLDDQLRSYTQTGEFEKSGNVMRSHVAEENISNFIHRVYQLGDTFSVTRSIYDEQLGGGEGEQAGERAFNIINTIEGQAGEAQIINDLSMFGADIIRQGHRKFTDFRNQLQKHFEPVWEKIKRFARRVWTEAKKIVANERGQIGTGSGKWKESLKLYKEYIEKNIGATKKQIQTATGLSQYEIDNLLDLEKAQGGAAIGKTYLQRIRESDEFKDYTKAIKIQNNIQELRKEAPEIFKSVTRRFSKGFVDRDMKWWNRAFETPYVLGKKFKSMYKAVNAEIHGAESRSTMLHEDLEGDLGELIRTFDKNRFWNKAERKELKSLIWKWDGRRFPKREVPNNAIEISDDIDVPLVINDKYYKQARAYLKKVGESNKVISAFLIIRRKLDEKLIDINETMASNLEDPNLIQEYRSDIGKKHNYFPHRRTGNAYVRIVDKETGNVLYREHYGSRRDQLAPINRKARTKAEAWVNERLAAGKLEGNSSRYKITQGAVTQLPDEVFFQIPVEAMQQIAKAAGVGVEQERIQERAEKYVATGQARDMEHALKLARGRLRKDFEVIISKSIADVFKARGWARHSILRKGIPGHETDDVFGILFDYLSGYAGFKTKIERSKRHHDTLAVIDAKNNPNEYRYVSNYIRDMLANSDKVDRAVDTLRGLFFVKYLGGVIKSGFVNLTQNVVMAAPILSIYTKGADLKLVKAMIATRRALTSKAAWVGRQVEYGLKGDEARAMNDLIESGASQDLFLRELKGSMPGIGMGKYYKKFVDKAGIFMQIAEKFNRASTGLAAFRIAKNEMGMEYDQALEFAKKRIYDAHFLYGKHNLPSAMRGGTFRKVVRSGYTFRSFSHNYMNMISHMLFNQADTDARSGWAARVAVARSLRNVMLVGGLVSFPFFKLFADMLMKVIDKDDEDFLTKIRENLPNKWTRDLVTYGLPGIGGIDLSGSLSIEAPRNWKDVIGVPYAIMEDTVNTMESWKSGQKFRALSETPITPIAVRNLMRGMDLYIYGQTTRSGRVISKPGTITPQKLTVMQAILKSGFGLQQTELSSGYAAWRASKKAQDVINSKKKYFASRYVNAIRRNDNAQMQKIVIEITEWNQEATRMGKPYMAIDIRDMVRRRLQPSIMGTPRAMRGNVLRTQQAWQ